MDPISKMLPTNPSRLEFCLKGYYKYQSILFHSEYIRLGIYIYVYNITRNYYQLCAANFRRRFIRKRPLNYSGKPRSRPWNKSNMHTHIRYQPKYFGEFEFKFTSWRMSIDDL